METPGQTRVQEAFPTFWAWSAGSAHAVWDLAMDLAD